MKPIVGIAVRKEDDIYYSKVELIDSLIIKGVIPIIIKPDIESANLCDGIIFPGGIDIYDDDLKLIKYLYDNDIPCFGICLGMQEMGYLFNGGMGYIGNYSHLKPDLKYVHDVKINKNSKIYKILNLEEIKVNSRHKDYLINTDLSISGISDVIESIEDKNKSFFIGVQWHPESMLKYDNNSNLIFNQFIKECYKYKLTKKYSER